MWAGCRLSVLSLIHIYAVGKRQGDVEFVGRKEDALALVVRQPSQQRAEFVAVGQVEKRGGFVQ